MFQRDYILRMIEMMGDLMRRVKELMDELSQMRLMEEACRRYCGLPMQTLEALDAKSLCELLGPVPRLFASELLYTRATSFALAAEDAETLKLKCLRLLCSLWEESSVCELRFARLEALKEELLTLLNADDLMLCADFFSQAEAYNHMEDAIFQAMERCPADSLARHAARGETLLRQAAKAGEYTLALANMTAQELRESARELVQTFLR